MSHNTFGHLFRVTTFGESHGPAIGCVVDGCPPGIALTEADIQPWLDRRKPGQSKYVTQRKEPDQVRILSGVFQDERMREQLTTGTPIALVIENVDARPKDYSDIRDKFRPGHADYTYWAKYGLRDYRGGGRQSARETAARVAAGAIARKILDRLYGGVTIRAALIQMGTLEIDRARWDWDEVTRNPFNAPDAGVVNQWADYLEGLRKAGSSCGAIVEVVADGIPAGLGAPVYGKLDADIAAALMGINAVKGVEIGAGMSAAALTGEENADEMRAGKTGRPEFLSNQAGGILGGISTGQTIVELLAVKPTSKILKPHKTNNVAGDNTEI
jgi:chorismate synthase